MTKKTAVIWGLSVIVLIFVFVAAYFFYNSWLRDNSAEYALLIDAGSSGSRIHLYKWLPEDGDRIPIITELRLEKRCRRVDPGLSKLIGYDYADKTRPTVSKLLALLISCAKLELTDRVANFQKIPLYLMATGGMRLLKSGENQRHKEIMKQVRAYLAGAPFDLRNASEIDAREEALYAWVAANYLNGSLGKASNNETIGILELGGASAQIAFVPKNPKESKPKDIAFVSIPGGEHWVYATGYDGVGKEEFIKAFEGGDSCYPEKFEATVEDSGANNYKKCQDQIIEHFNPEKNEVFTPLREYSPLAYDKKYLALSNFYHTPNFFWQKYDQKFSELESAGIDYCKKNWEVILEENKKVLKKFLEEYCLMAAYISALLTTEGFSGINFKGGGVMLQLEGSEDEVDWTLGALICLLYRCRFGS